MKTLYSQTPKNMHANELSNKNHWSGQKLLFLSPKNLFVVLVKHNRERFCPFIVISVHNKVHISIFTQFSHKFKIRSVFHRWVCEQRSGISVSIACINLLCSHLFSFIALKGCFFFCLIYLLVYQKTSESKCGVEGLIWGRVRFSSAIWSPVFQEPAEYWLYLTHVCSSIRDCLQHQSP